MSGYPRQRRSNPEHGEQSVDPLPKCFEVGSQIRPTWLVTAWPSRSVSRSLRHVVDSATIPCPGLRVINATTTAPAAVAVSWSHFVYVGESRGSSRLRRPFNAASVASPAQHHHARLLCMKRTIQWLQPRFDYDSTTVVLLYNLQAM